MYKVNVTPADSFNDSGCAPNYEHDEEHDEGDYPSLNGNNEISLNNINTNAFSTEFKDLPTNALIQTITKLSENHESLKDFVEKFPTGKKNPDKKKWTVEVLEHCKKMGIVLPPKPARNPKKTKKVAKAHHLEHFSVEEHMGNNGPYLKIYHKHHHHKKHTYNPKHDGYHAPEFNYDYSIKPSTGKSHHESETSVALPSTVTHMVRPNPVARRT